MAAFGKVHGPKFCVLIHIFFYFNLLILSFKVATFVWTGRKAPQTVCWKWIITVGRCNISKSNCLENLAWSWVRKKSESYRMTTNDLEHYKYKSKVPYIWSSRSPRNPNFNLFSSTACVLALQAILKQVHPMTPKWH